MPVLEWAKYFSTRVALFGRGWFHCTASCQAFFLGNRKLLSCFIYLVLSLAAYKMTSYILMKKCMALLPSWYLPVLGRSWPILGLSGPESKSIDWWDQVTKYDFHWLRHFIFLMKISHETRLIVLHIGSDEARFDRALKNPILAYPIWAKNKS